MDNNAILILTKKVELYWTKLLQNRFFRIIFWVASLPLLFITLIRRLYYTKIPSKRKAPPVNTICIGNISLGGSGKTPCTLFAVELLTKHSEVGILSRGYGGQFGKKPHLVSSADTAITVGDEAILYFQKSIQNNTENRSISVVISHSRNAGVELLKKLGVKTIIMDDGLQHYAIRPTRTACLIPLEYSVEYHKLQSVFPASHFREAPALALKQYDKIVFTKKGALDEEDFKEISRICRTFSIKNHSIIELRGDELYRAPEASQGILPSEIKGHGILVTSVAQPNTVLNAATTMGLTIKENLFYPDHHQFNNKDIEDLSKSISKANYAICTEKDWVKLQLLIDYQDKFFILKQRIIDHSPETSRLDNWLTEVIKFE